ncbi:MAG: DUF4191 domain-containing protein [Actinomycetales bacterium]|nr:DUF4191 domain-containing protein [Actinomycetales bacterium]
MARSKSSDATSSPKEKKQGRLAQLWTIFRMTRKADPAVVWWMLLGFFGTLAVSAGVGVLIDRMIFVVMLGLPIAFLLALVIMARRAERAAYANIEGQVGATATALRNLRRGWTVEEQPVAIDPRTQDHVIRAIGRPGVVLVTEGPLPRVARLVDKERKRITRVLPNVPVHVIHAGSGEGQVPLRKLTAKITRMRPVLSKTQAAEVTKHLRALGGARPPIPKGIDPFRARPDRRALRGR